MDMILQAGNLEKTYKRGAEVVYALRGINLEINYGELVAVLGPSGSGKTTLLQIMGCLDRPSGGELIIDGSAVETLSGSALESLRRDRIGFIFQQFQLVSSLNVQENVLLPLLFSRRKPDYAYLDNVLQTVGMEHRRKHLPDQLSGGEMQRVAVARALINRPGLILADEPTGNLDSENSSRIFELLKKLNQQGVTIVFVTHNHELADMAGKRIMIRDGSIEAVHAG
ncbi:ABC transporter ATP-binding protein [Desulfonatronospira sp.]|uniref:ABC transporter ATP-binding protein n=1 Tax=Desulfonatronospira sp. TaxID=1962951 RepID=UPI0025BA7ADD|nr:ABC transporter ATP-binding protein [Desulfonatronospira sp.]